MRGCFCNIEFTYFLCRLHLPQPTTPQALPRYAQRRSLYSNKAGYECKVEALVLVLKNGAGLCKPIYLAQDRTESGILVKATTKIWVVRKVGNS
jgi:hypothetical protein